jgi:hypothetical protein
MSEQIVALLIQERNRLDTAIQALRGTVKHQDRLPGRVRRRSLTTPNGAPKAQQSHPKRKLSAAGRKAIAEAARRRWALIRAGKGSAKRQGRSPQTITPNGTNVISSATKQSHPKRKLSAAGRKAIVDAAKRRWALIKAGKAKSPFAKAEKKAA